MVIKDIIQKYSQTLKKSNIESFLLDAELLLAYVLEVEKNYIILNPDIEINVKQEKAFQKLIARRANHEPLQYIINKAHFYGIEFYVDKNVLIPRPDTEILIETILKIAQPTKKYNILDIGTGSGCIAIALAKHLPNSNITAIDVSQAALKIAKINAQSNNITNINFLHHDIKKEFSQENSSPVSF